MADLFGESETKFEDLPETKTEIKSRPIAMPTVEIDTEAAEEQAQELYKGCDKRIDDFCEEYEIPKGISNNLVTHPALGWSKLSPIQAKTLPDLLQTSNNMIVQSQSGTGKTGCFSLAMLKAIDLNIRQPQVICMAPTLELAQQIHNVIAAMVKEVEGYSDCLELVVKGSNVWNAGMIEKQIVVGTPGKIMNRINVNKLDLSEIKLFVLDEADLLLQQEKEKTNPAQAGGFAPQFNQSNQAAGANMMGGAAEPTSEGLGFGQTPQTPMSQDIVNIKSAIDTALSNAGKPPVRILLFSATFEAEGEIGQEDKADLEKQKVVFETFAHKIIPDANNLITHVIPREKQTLKLMKQFWIDAESIALKKDVVKDLLMANIEGQTIIFTNKRETAMNLGKYLTIEGFSGVSVLHGEMTPEERSHVMNEFKTQSSKILITTNVSSRGLDISTVTHVINYDLPMMKVQTPEGHARWMIEPATYLHRTGRTARFGKTGTAINILGRLSEKELIEELEKYFKIKIQEITKAQVEKNEIDN